MQKDYLQMTPEEMRQLGHRVVDALVEHFSSVADKPVTRTNTPAAMSEAVRAPFSEDGQPAEQVLEHLKAVVFTNMMHLDHPRFFGFVPSPSNYVSAITDALVAGYNAFAGTWLEAAGPVQVELDTIDWLCREIGLPETAGGLFVSGGSAANLTALAVARHVRIGKAFSEATVYYSDQTHSSVDRALAVLGFHPGRIRRLPSDECFQLPIDELARAVAIDRRHGRDPLCVIANAGTTNTGAVDQLQEIAEFCWRENLWFHIDGAYGAPAALCDRGRELLRGLGNADSLTLDPHKWLFQPYETGCLLVKESAHLRQTFRSVPDYLQDTVRNAGDQEEPSEINFSEYGIQLSRGFRALKLWTSLNVFGVRAFRAAIEKGLELGLYAEQRIEASEHLELVAPAQLAIVAFRYEAQGLSPYETNQLNERLVKAMIDDGSAFVSSTMLKGQSTLRMCTINPRTTEADIDLAISHLEALGEKLLAGR